MKQLRSTFLISLIGFFISYAPIAKAQDVMGISVASFLSLKSMKDVAEADEISEKTALLVIYKNMNRSFQLYIKYNRCWKVRIDVGRYKSNFFWRPFK